MEKENQIIENLKVDEYKIGEKILRKNHGYPDEPDEWIPTTINETYLELIKEFPEDFKKNQQYGKGKVRSFKL